PIERGILATVVIPNPGGCTAEDALAAYRRTYVDAPFVRVVDPRKHLPSVRDVALTNFCDLAPAVDESGGSIVVVGVIDNLLKGAAGQAVQVMNLVMGIDETTGLTKR
ncbi:MAG: N-acetyl-gamma-glutamyl-phosphate reductase, partial [Deltaproteobacteria bacterium]|nr:N-acetyl-gamma-glutamyl-phosphate reductase [Deltaproteobacteria bacterium]